MISARWSRQRPVNDTISGCCPHQWDSAAVHSRARPSACASRQPSMTLQYMRPVTIGESSPPVTATITSSSRPSPSEIRPSLTSALPCS